MIKFFLIGAFFLFASYSNAQFVATNNQYGCKDTYRGGNGNTPPTGNSQRIYYQKTATDFSGLPTFETQSAPYSEWNLDQLTPANQCFTFVITSVGGCYVRRGISPYTYTIGDYGYWANSLKCPIDDYIYLLMLGCGIIGFVYIKLRV